MPPTAATGRSDELRIGTSVAAAADAGVLRTKRYVCSARPVTTDRSKIPTVTNLSRRSLPASHKFLHLIYEYRYLALVGAAWSRFGPAGAAANRKAANRLLPGIGVIVQDSLLAHARLLIDFYTKKASGTDIVLADFGLPAISTTMKKELIRYKKPIEVHLLHLTTWRDVPYRRQERKTPDGAERQRVDWNRHNSKIVDRLIRALEIASKPKGASWREPFYLLHRSAKAILANPAAGWPKELGEKRDMTAYLASLGLT
jgi:hypothetical protein